MLLLFFLTTALSGVISMYLTQESPKMSADYDQSVPVIDITHFFRPERDLENKDDDTPTTKKYLSISLGGQTETLKSKRSGLNRPSLSIVNPLDVLRQKLLLDIERNRKQSQIDKNREYLQKIGKRSIVESLFSE